LKISTTFTSPASIWRMSARMPGRFIELPE
jgi:hypothetical protein